MGNKVGQKYRQSVANLQMRVSAGDRSFMNEVEKNFNSDGALQQICRNELNIQKTSIGKRTIEDDNSEERRLKLLKIQSDIDYTNTETEKKKADAKAVLIVAEAKANKINAEAEKIKADANKTNADSNKTNADAEKIRFQTKNLYSEELRKQLSYIQTVDNKAKISGPEQQLWKDVAAEAKNNLHNFVTQQPADRENPAETD